MAAILICLIVALFWGLVIFTLKQDVKMEKPIDTKFFEIRDHATLMPAIGIKMSHEGRSPNEKFLLGTSGYGRGGKDLILLVFTGINQCHYDPHEWHPHIARTRHFAHLYIQDNFDSLESGSVIDVRHILGETKEPAKSDMYYDWSDYEEEKEEEED